MTPPTPADHARSRRDRWFQTDDLVRTLGRRSARGGVYTLGSTAFSFLATTIATVLITRQLTDEDFGLYGMVIVLTGFAALFADLGLSRAVVQRPVVTHEQVSTLFWINLAIAAALAAGVAAATPLLVAAYQEPRLATINLAMSGLFLVNSLGRQHRALLQRRMEFARINLVATAVVPVGAVAGIAVAYLGGAYWALVAIPAGTSVAGAIGMWIACDWRPGPPRRGAGVRSMLAFGGHVTGFQVINYFARNADNAMLGYAWGAGPLGLYTRAYSLMMLPAQKINNPLSGVVIPMLSRLADQPERYRRAHIEVLSLLTSVMTPIVVLLILCSPEMVLIFFGQKWIEMIPVFLALGPACVMAASNSAAGWLYQSIGHVHRQVHWVTIQTLILIPSMLIGLQFGPIGMAIAVSTVYVAVKPFTIRYATIGTFVRTGPILRAIYEPIGMASAAAATSWWAAHLAQMPTGATAAIKFAVYLACYAVVYFWTPVGRQTRSRMRVAISKLRGQSVPKTS